MFRKGNFGIAGKGQNKVVQGYLGHMAIHASYIVLTKLVLPLRGDFSITMK